MKSEITATHHFVNGRTIRAPFPAGLEQAMFAMGCFWGVERLFWPLPGVYTTAVESAASLGGSVYAAARGLLAWKRARSLAAITWRRQ